MVKNICILRSNPIKPDSRVEKEAYSLMSNGFNVEILCWDRDSNHEVSNDLLRLNEINIPIHRIGYKATFGEGFKNIKAYLKFQLKMRSWIRKNHYRFDAVHACDFDTAFFTYALVKRLKIKFVFDIFDFLYGEPHNLFQKIVKKTQLRIIDKSDATIICTEERQNQITGSVPKKLIVIHNTPPSSQYKIADCFNLDNDLRIKICYVGILQNGRLLKEIGKFVSLNQEYSLHIGGFGYLESYFRDLDKRFDNIFFYGRIPYEQTLELESKCDIMLAIYDPTIENHRFAAPNKFYESLFLGKPVIMVHNTGMSSYITKYNIGTLIDYSYDGFQKGVYELTKMKNGWDCISQLMKSIYEEQFNWTIMEKRLIELYYKL